MTCPTCNNAAHIEYPTGISRCNACDRSPAACRCTPVPVVPEWLRRAREGRGLAKDLTERGAA